MKTLGPLFTFFPSSIWWMVEQPHAATIRGSTSEAERRPCRSRAWDSTPRRVPPPMPEQVTLPRRKAARRRSPRHPAEHRSQGRSPADRSSAHNPPPQGDLPPFRPPPPSQSPSISPPPRVDAGAFPVQSRFDREQPQTRHIFALFESVDSILQDPAASQKLHLLPWPMTEILPASLLRKVIAELIATFLLVFVTCGSAALSHSDPKMVSQLGQSVAGGLIVTVMIYSVGHISGAHMNPTVTLVFAVSRHFPWIQVPFYMLAQLSGAMIAAFTLHELLHPIHILGTTTPSGSAGQALVLEIVVTFTMMFVTSAVATDTKAVGELAGLAVGSAVCITSIFAGPISVGSMNPARSIAPAVASNEYNAIWVYILGPVVGTLSGAWSYNFIRVTENPTKVISQRQSFFKLRSLQSQDSINKDALENL